MKKIIIISVAIFLLSFNLVRGQWSPLNSGTSNFLVSTSFITPDSGYVADDHGNVYMTTNGGSNWNMIASLNTYSTMSIDFFDTQNGILVGDSVFKTSDGGNSWQRVINDTALLWFWKVKYISKDTVVISGFDQFDLTGYVMMSYNGGSTWVNKGVFPNNAITTCSFINSKVGYALCDSGIVKTINGGTSWCNIDSGSVGANEITFLNKDTGFAVGGNNIYKTTDGGLNWSTISQSFSGPFYAICFNNPDTGYVGGGNGINSGTLIKSNNGGLSWLQATTTTQTISCIDFPNANTGYATGTNGTILKYSALSNVDENNTLSKEITIFPNPANDKISINVPEKTKIEMLNIEGKIIKTINYTDNIYTIDLKDLSIGVYIIKAINDNWIVTNKFIKQ